MKRLKNSGLLILILLLAHACTSDEYYRVRIRIPRRAEVQLAEFKGIVITDFLIKTEFEDFNLSEELKEYFAGELEVELDKSVQRENFVAPDEESFEDQEFWKTLPLEAHKSLIFSGTAEYSQETRKALISKDKEQFEDPFPSQERLATRKFYTLQVNIRIINSETGEVTYSQDFKESKSYTNPNQTAYFALFDLAYLVKEKLFREIMGGERFQQRYLIHY
ncbi:MAG: hypothetical protein GQ544_00475 [Candidatus Aminicenantes bacterium]|nr:hypothetical protein [Candidatus Aminicenantes bacterium]